ncbi:DUF2157 domain-containing protein [Desulfocurvibacter africanus]|uniref:DUF2157 domain-containing protein n=1 Tax=Desulfocurvibacter africanus TaxID=873 RepID=UPI000401864E|nr:DUF2157 domain-containing protein [Desulfocurvibacter africanus]
MPDDPARISHAPHIEPLSAIAGPGSPFLAVIIGIDTNKYFNNPEHMKTNRKHASVVHNALEHWNRAGLLDDTTALALQQDIEVISFDWKRLAKYSFWIALICIVTAIGAALADDVLLALLESLFDAPYSVKFFGLSGLSGAIYWFGIKRRKKHPHKIFSNEAILFLGVLATAGAIYQLGRVFDSGSGHFSILLLLAFLVYGLLGFHFRSNLVWLFALTSLGSWMGTETGYVSGWGAYYLGMNYPLRFVLFGAVLCAVALTLEKKGWFAHLSRSTLAMGLLYLFIALWIMSIFGNYGDMDSWERIRQIELFHWSLLFGLVAAGAVYHGLRYENGMTKGFGITFLLINLYTRFFEHFWDASHKAVFFGLLGISFWLLGSRAEKIWHLGAQKKEPCEVA